jgi:dihydroorotate dehydrogenase electron transfer subunit
MTDRPAFLQRTVEVVEQVPLAERTYRLRFVCPELAQRLKPGQFLMLRIPGTTDPLLGRPFAYYDTTGDGAVDVVYLVVGKMTARLAATRVGERLEVWGPLGNGFVLPDPPTPVVLVAGGIGQTPFLAYAKALLARGCPSVTLYYGVRSGSLAAGVSDFEAAGVAVRLSSDDGTLGERGYVTDRLSRESPPGVLVGCGPEPMLHALRRLALRWQRECYLSLETPMACGVGICYSCVTKVKTAQGWDYRRVCVEGPVFRADELAD